MSAEFSLFQLDTAFTDYLLCIEALLFLGLLARLEAKVLRFKLMAILLFATLAGASLLGGISHSFLTDPGSNADRALWLATLLMIGGIGWSAWNLGASLLSRRWQTTMIALSSVALLIYASVVIWISQRYLIAIGHYLIGVIFLLGALGATLRRTQQSGTGQALIGVLLSVFAPAPHVLNYSPLPERLSPNATYHLLQAFALILIFTGIKRLLPRFVPPNGSDSKSAPHTAALENPQVP